MDVRTGRLVVTAQHTDRFIVENDKMNSYTDAESDLSLEVHDHSCTGWSDRVRKRHWTNPQKDSTQDSSKHSLIWWNVYVFNIASICIHGEE